MPGGERELTFLGHEDPGTGKIDGGIERDAPRGQCDHTQLDAVGQLAGIEPAGGPEVDEIEGDAIAGRDQCGLAQCRGLRSGQREFGAAREGDRVHTRERNPGEVRGQTHAVEMARREPIAAIHGIGVGTLQRAHTERERPVHAGRLDIVKFPFALDPDGDGTIRVGDGQGLGLVTRKTANGGRAILDGQGNVEGVVHDHPIDRHGAIATIRGHAQIDALVVDIDHRLGVARRVKACLECTDGRHVRIDQLFLELVPVGHAITFHEERDAALDAMEIDGVAGMVPQTQRLEPLGVIADVKGARVLSIRDLGHHVLADALGLHPVFRVDTHGIGVHVHVDPHRLAEQPEVPLDRGLVQRTARERHVLGQRGRFRSHHRSHCREDLGQARVQVGLGNAGDMHLGVITRRERGVAELQRLVGRHGDLGLIDQPESVDVGQIQGGVERERARNRFDGYRQALGQSAGIQ